MEQDNTQDIERKVVNALLQQGMNFKLPKRGLLKWLSKNKDWQITIKQPYLGTLDTISGLSLEMGLNEEKLQENPINESKVLIHKSAKKAAKVIAVAMLNNKWLIRLFAGILAHKLMWRVKPDTLFQLVMLINTLNNTQDFINSIRLIQGVRTTTPQNLKANRVEEKKEA